MNKTEKVENIDPDHNPATASVLPIEGVLHLRVKETAHMGEDALDPRLLAHVMWKITQKVFAFFTIIVNAIRLPKIAP